MEPPRTLDQRIADTLALLATPHADIWVATASPDGDAHLVPLSYAWTGARIVLSTDSTMATARNLVASGKARLGTGHTRDVVMIDAELESVHPVGDAPDEVSERFAEQSDWDARTAGEPYVFLVLRPVRIQAWREGNEITGRTLMRDGEWLAPAVS
jgi:Pyridoxamine 5'-phosphate oxidase